MALSGLCFSQTYISKPCAVFGFDRAECWDVFPDGTGCISNGDIPPLVPSTGNCEVHVVINEDVTLSSGLSLGGNFRSITFGDGGGLTVNGGMTMRVNSNVNVYGFPGNDGDILNYLTAASITMEDKSRISLDEKAGLVIIGETIFKNKDVDDGINAVATIDVNRYFKTGAISSMGKSTGIIHSSEGSYVLVERDVVMNGNSNLVFRGKGPHNGESHVDIGGEIVSNGTNAKITADNATVWVCGDIPDPPAVYVDELNSGEFDDRCRVSLPVHWLYVRSVADRYMNEVKIDWATSKEWDNSHFEIERSIDGIEGFKKIGSVLGQGWASEVSNYQFVDDKLPIHTGRVYYRIKQVDYNGSFRYSEVVSEFFSEMKMITGGSWVIYPNPANDKLTWLRLREGKLGEGDVVYVRLLSPGRGSTLPVRLPASNNNEWEISELTSHLPQGLYVLEISWASHITRLKLIKQF